MTTGSDAERPSPYQPLHIQEGGGEPWRRWFARRPVKSQQGGWVWLRRTWRRHYWPAPWFILEAQGGWNEYSDTKQSFWERRP